MSGINRYDHRGAWLYINKYIVNSNLITPNFFESEKVCLGRFEKKHEL